MKLTSLISLIFFLSCTSIPVFSPVETARDRIEFIAHAPKSMVSTSHPIATEAGLDMLRAGGNAMDAAAAVSFALSVVRPQSTGIGGGGFMLYYDTSTKMVKVYDFRERAPIRATKKMFLDRSGKPKSFSYKGKTIPEASVNGHLAVGVPGLVAGVLKAHRAHGKLSRKAILDPSIQAAQKGFPVYVGLAEAAKARADVLSKFEDSRQLFVPNGKPLDIGDQLIQKDLANTLKTIRDKGEASFYRGGSIARKIVAEMRRGRGKVSLRDLKEYKVIEREPVESLYRGYRIVSMPPPSSGGVHIIQMLNMLESYDLKKLGYGTTQYYHVMAEVMRRAFADRAKYLGDPDFVKVPTNGLTDKRYAKELVAGINSTRATPSKQVFAGNPASYESRSTTHFSIVDQWGNAVSSTQTINGWFGSGVVAQGTGIVLNNEMDDFSKKPGVPNQFGLVGSEANAIAARKTMLSSMSPTLVFDKKGGFVMALGSPGGPRIINATLQTIVHHVDFNMGLEDAVHAYRIHHQWLPDQILIEHLDEDVAEALRNRGHKLKPFPSVGGVQAVGRSEEGGLIGVADTRREGYPKGL